MRLFKLGKVTKRGKLGIRVLVVSLWNPFNGWFAYRRSGYGRWLRLPGIKFLCLKECGQGQCGKRRN